MTNFLLWLGANKNGLFAAAVAADTFARSAGWHEPIWVGAIIIGLGAYLGFDHVRQVMAIRKAARLARIKRLKRS